MAAAYPGWGRLLGTRISHRTLPLRSLVMNRAGTRTAFQVSPAREPDRSEPDLTTIRPTVVFLHGSLFLEYTLKVNHHRTVSHVRRTRRRNQPKGQKLLQSTKVQNRPLRSAWIWKINSVRRYPVPTPALQHQNLTVFPDPGARVSRKTQLGTWSSRILLSIEMDMLNPPPQGRRKGSGTPRN